MFLTLLEYLLIRVAFGLVVLLFRAAGLVMLAALWLLGALAAVVVRPLSRELARAIGRGVGHARLALRGRRRPLTG